MTLSSKLNDVLFLLGCPHCGREENKKGSWLKSARRFLCAGCGGETRVTYSDKIMLFEKHSRSNRGAT
ncbi:hypothetical protein SAMN05519103_09543 [Rhizobiales bacterium GAS113]|nr:hypothetical protein SAMN05519103_09543 [Rhizobiales bacterium GAS113]